MSWVIFLMDATVCIIAPYVFVSLTKTDICLFGLGSCRFILKSLWSDAPLFKNLFCCNWLVLIRCFSLLLLKILQEIISVIWQKLLNFENGCFQFNRMWFFCSFEENMGFFLHGPNNIKSGSFAIYFKFYGVQQYW